MIFGTQATGQYATSSHSQRVPMKTSTGVDTSPEDDQPVRSRNYIRRGEDSSSKRQKSRESLEYSVARFCDYMVEADQRDEAVAIPDHAQVERTEHEECERILFDMGVDFDDYIEIIEFLMKNHTFRARFIKGWTNEQRWRFLYRKFTITSPPTAP